MRPLSSNYVKVSVPQNISNYRESVLEFNHRPKSQLRIYLSRKKSRVEESRERLKNRRNYHLKYSTQDNFSHEKKDIRPFVTVDHPSDDEYGGNTLKSEYKSGAYYDDRNYSKMSKTNYYRLNVSHFLLFKILIFLLFKIFEIF